MRWTAILCCVLTLQFALLAGIPGVNLTPRVHAQDTVDNETESTDRGMNPERTNWYLGGGIGNSELKDDDLSDEFDSLDLDDDDNGFKVFLGYNLTRRLSVEAAYVDLGDFPFEGTISGSQSSGGEEIDGISLTPLVRMPVLPYLDLFAKGGLFTWDIERSTDAVADLSSENSTDFTYGAGVDLNLWRPIGVRGEWERYEMDDVEVNMLSLDLMYHF